MSEDRVRWGVTVLDANGKRYREVGAPYDSRSKALRRAGGYEDHYEPRLVKLTRWAKGWRPASEPPKHQRMVLIIHCDGVRTLAAYSGGEWSSPRSAAVAHWRELPAGPKSEATK